VEGGAADCPGRPEAHGLRAGHPAAPLRPRRVRFQAAALPSGRARLGLTSSGSRRPVRQEGEPGARGPGAVPDILAARLLVVFCGINPGRRSAASGAHFANPRNDFWRLLHEAGFTPRLLAPSEQWSVLRYGVGLTNAARRTTAGSGDLRSADFADSAARLEQLALELRPRALAFVGKEAYRGAFGERPRLGPQRRRLGETLLYVLPSTSPANAAVPYRERLKWFRDLRRLLASRATGS
jgi:TDG/mug DNA glycosylase family protein